MTDGPFDAEVDEDWWDAVLKDPRARVRPDDEEDGFFLLDDWPDK